MKQHNFLLLVLIIFSYSTDSHAQVDLDAGLDIHYPFDNTDIDFKGSTELRSNSNYTYGLGSDGSANSSVEFNGQENFIEIDKTRDRNPINDWCVSLYLKIEPVQMDANSTGVGIVSKWILDNGDHENKGYPIVLRTINSNSPDEGKLFFNISEGFNGICNHTSQLKTNLTYNDGIFHHVVFGREDGLMMLYVDCELIGEIKDETECSTANDANIILGARNETFSFNRRNRFTGAIDDFRLYDRFLSEEEITFLCDIGGCDGNYVETLKIEICEGDVLVFNGETISETGSYQQMLKTKEDCDSILNIEVEVVDVLESFEDYQICKGDVLILNGETISQAGTYQQFFESVGGCDSILNIEILILGIAESYEEYHGCIDDGYEIKINGTTYNEERVSGVEMLTSSKGCDSIVNVELTFVSTKTYIPNIISVTSAVNNIFKPYFSMEEINYELNIYDRWGSKVFSGLNEGWNGKLQNAFVASGVYVYIITPETKCQKDPLIGSFTVIK